MQTLKMKKKPATATTKPKAQEVKAEVVQKRKAKMGVPKPVAKQSKASQKAKMISAEEKSQRAVQRQQARKALEARIEKFRHTKVEFMPNLIFEEADADPQLAAEILGPAPEAGGRKGRQVQAPEGLPAYMAALYDVPLLARGQEAHLFRKMNYLKHRAFNFHHRHSGSKPPRTAIMNEFDRLMAEVTGLCNGIIRANLRLVISIAKKRIGLAGESFYELVSDGNMSLIRAVEKFDYSRGFKFSTYASWAVMKNFNRSISEESQRIQRYPTDMGDVLEGAADRRNTSETKYELGFKAAKEACERYLDLLNDRERRIVTSRYGLHEQEEKTLEQLGKELGITKERVRQIEGRAHEKMRQRAMMEQQKQEQRERPILPTSCDSAARAAVMARREDLKKPSAPEPSTPQSKPHRSISSTRARAAR